MFKVNNRNDRTRCEICSKLTIKTPERRHWHRSGVFFVIFEHTSHLAPVLLHTLKSDSTAIKLPNFFFVDFLGDTSCISKTREFTRESKQAFFDLKTLNKF